MIDCDCYRGDCGTWTRANSCGGEACEEQRKSSCYCKDKQQTPNQGEAYVNILRFVYCTFFNLPKCLVLHWQVVEEIITDETPKKATESVVEDILANEISTPTGIRYCSQWALLSTWQCVEVLPYGQAHELCSIKYFRSLIQKILNCFD